MTEHPDRVGEILAELKEKTPASASKPPVAASGMLHTFFNEFLEQNLFVDGKKNEFLLSWDVSPAIKEWARKSWYG